MSKKDDPAVRYGPGMWFMIHRMALIAGENTSCGECDRDFVVKSLYDLSENHPCLNCRRHMQKYLQSHDIYREPDLFKYTVDFHNDVNRRLGKIIIPLSEAELIYLGSDEDNGSCNSDCGSEPESGSEDLEKNKLEEDDHYQIL